MFDPAVTVTNLSSSLLVNSHEEYCCLVSITLTTVLRSRKQRGKPSGDGDVSGHDSSPFMTFAFKHQTSYKTLLLKLYN